MDLRISNLSKSFGRIKALDTISMEISGNGIIGYLGPNGAGKTTTIKVMAGLIRPDSGDVFINGFSVTSDKRTALSKISSVVETPSPYPYLTVKEYLLLIGSLRGMEPNLVKNKIDELQKTFRLEDLNQSCGHLSKGNKQRVILMAAFLPEAEIIILDEPTSGLDPIESKIFRDYMKILKREKLLFISSHLMFEVSDLCDEVIFINKGKIISRMSVAEVNKMFEGKGALGMEEAYIEMIGGDK